MSSTSDGLKYSIPSPPISFKEPQLEITGQLNDIASTIGKPKPS